MGQDEDATGQQQQGSVRAPLLLLARDRHVGQDISTECKDKDSSIGQDVTTMGQGNTNTGQ